jgi:hypothetical protein
MCCSFALNRVLVIDFMRSETTRTLVSWPRPLCRYRLNLAASLGPDDDSRFNDQTLLALAEAPAQHPADDPCAWEHRANTYLTEVKCIHLNVLLFLGSVPEEYEPDKVLRDPRKEGPLEAGVAGRPLPWARRLIGPASRPTVAEEYQPTGRKLQVYRPWRARSDESTNRNVLPSMMAEFLLS